MRGLSKWWQRWVLDAVLTHPPPLVAVVIAIFLTVFAVGFWCAHWLDQVDLAVYRSLDVFSDNIRGENLLGKLSGVLPIDVVYTWVNGSDPLLLSGLRALSDGIQDSCPLSHCMPAPYISLMDCSTPKATFSNIPFVVEATQRTMMHNSRSHNFTILRLTRERDIPEVMEKVMMIAGNTSMPKQAYWTSDVGGGWGMKQKNAVLVTGTADLSHAALLQTIFPQYKNGTPQCSVSGSGGVHMVECQEEGLVSGALLSKSHQETTLTNSSLRLHQAMLMLQPDREDHLKEIDANRFEDNEELRYSLRSLEKYAPWVRRIYLVTNGQIPHWLNLDHPRLTIITHQDIFPNTSHLPTYSSPAIESHIHRIPGLSEHFLYLNDDVMFGSEVWPEDFFSPGDGYKVYLSWSLPECSSGCPGSWLGDGYCDESCNTSACEWDGGDCSGGESGEGDLLDGEVNMGLDGAVDFCAPSCSDMWLADRYCDSSCNTLMCGFDGGDCGLDKMYLLHQLPVPTTLNATYILPRGVGAAWMNISSLLSSGNGLQGWHTEHSGLRTLNVNTAQKALFILMRSNITSTIHIQLSISKQEEEQEEPQKSTKVSFILKFNTHHVEVNKSTDQKDVLPLVALKNFTFKQVEPKVGAKDIQQDNPLHLELAYVNVNASMLPASVVSKINQLEALYREGDMILDGLKRKKSKLIAEFLHSAADHQLVYHRKSEWPSDIKQNKNNSSPHDQNNLRKPDYSAKGTSKPQNSNEQLGSRTLLWAKDFQRRNGKKNLVKTFLDKQRFKGRKTYTTSNIRKDDISDNEGSVATYLGSLPWEKQKLFHTEDPQEEVRKHTLPVAAKRHLLDMFAESLLHVNRLFNSEYGYQARRVPAHMPHFISRGIMERLQEKFKDEFELTSFHKIRQANDMQYAFSYYFFLMSEWRIRTPTEVFQEFDTDVSGTLSDREIRTLLASLHDLPLHYNIVHEFHQLVKNCSANHHTKIIPTPVYERYADSDLPTVSLELMLRCEPLTLLLRKLEKVKKYKYSHLSDDAIHFKMVTSNVSIVIHMLDEVRKNKRKFICLNSNLDPKSKSNDLIHALVQDTYESLFPLPSYFELPLNYRNRFLYMEELVAWRKWRDFVRALIYACLASLVFLTLVNFFSAELEGLRRRWCRRRRRREGYGGLKV